MGSNSSTHQQHYGPSGGLAHEMRRGWTHSFPREIGKQPPRLKVLPEPSNQRLRATNNGSIIHNGGTISGRRPSASTLPHDLNKQEVFRVRSTSASTFMSARSPRAADRQDHRFSYRDRCDGRECEISELKRFGSEPDLRYSPTGERGRQDPRQAYAERDTRERESRYRGKKKYRAPAPPPGNGDGSSPDSYKWEAVGRDREGRQPEEIQPPPRRSRLFKTRAETKRAQIGWTSHQEQRAAEGCGKGWQNIRRERSTRENTAWREQDEERWEKEELKARLFDGKNTLQRSLSSPEFQAELMQAARRVRSKLLHCRRESPIGAATPASVAKEGSGGRIDQNGTRDDRRMEVDRRAMGRRQDERPEDRRVEKRNVRNRVERVDEILPEESRVEVRNVRIREGDDRQVVRTREREPLRKRLPKGSTKYEEDPAEVRGNSPEDRLSTGRRECSEDRRERDNDRPKNRKLNDVADVVTRTRSQSPAQGQSCREKADFRGRVSGRESTPEPAKIRDVASPDPRRWDGGVKGSEKRWSDSAVVKTEKKESKAKEKFSRKSDMEGLCEQNWEISPPAGKSPPKTFYFGMDETLTKESRDRSDQQVDRIQARLQSRDLSGSPEGHSVDTNQTNQERDQNVVDNIALKLRPTLPKKQLEIPRFSPSAAWRLLSALESPGPSMSTASEEIPVLFEERIERLSRPPPPLVALGPRSSHDKSGDSGISGDAGAANDDSLDIGMTSSRSKALARPTWTPQQDLGEESSSDAGVDSPPPMVTSKFPSRGHVFSLSLPRDTDHRLSLYNPKLKGKESSSFNSLQKLKKSVSGVFGLAPADLERKHGAGVLDDNWLLSSSAPNSLQHIQTSNVEGLDSPSPARQSNFAAEDDDEEEEEEEEEDEELEGKSKFPMIMKPPSFSYLASGGHVMYLPECGGTDYRMRSLNLASAGSENNDKISNDSRGKRERTADSIKRSSRYPAGTSSNERSLRETKSLNTFRDRSFTDSEVRSREHSSYSKSCENISEMEQRGETPSPGPENLQDSRNGSADIKAPRKQSSKVKRFTFQSTVRQIERRRLAEKLSREAEAKERQRKGELEAMRKVEEEFQRKRAREKANIRQQLRLFSMDENLSSLPPAWETSQLSRADPDGAPSSSASSPTSAAPGKLTTARKNSASSDEYHRKTIPSGDCRQQHREYKDYRSRYYDWGSESSSHLESKQTTVHPKVVYDIPKSSPVFVDANVHVSKPANPNTTPRSDNYRKDFAHGAVAGRSSLASSDSELSQPNTRPHSRQAKSKPHRSRSASPARSEDVSSEDEYPVERNPLNGLILNTVQPFVRKKSYRPITFNPQPSPPIPS